MHCICAAATMARCAHHAMTVCKVGHAFRRVNGSNSACTLSMATPFMYGSLNVFSNLASTEQQ